MLTVFISKFLILSCTLRQMSNILSVTATTYSVTAKMGATPPCSMQKQSRQFHPNTYHSPTIPIYKCLSSYISKINSASTSVCDGAVETLITHFLRQSSLSCMIIICAEVFDIPVNENSFSSTSFITFNSSVQIPSILLYSKEVNSRCIIYTTEVPHHSSKFHLYSLSDLFQSVAPEFNNSDQNRRL